MIPVCVDASDGILPRELADFDPLSGKDVVERLLERLRTALKSIPVREVESSVAKDLSFQTNTKRAKEKLHPPTGLMRFILIVASVCAVLVAGILAVYFIYPFATA